MTEQERIQLAKKAFDKGWTIDQLRYGDDLYGQEHETTAVWELVAEIQDIGRIEFNKRYPNAPLDQ